MKNWGIDVFMSPPEANRIEMEKEDRHNSVFECVRHGNRRLIHKTLQQNG